VAGFDPIAVDTASAALMGFDPRKLKILTRAEQPHKFPIGFVEKESIYCVSNNDSWNGDPHQFRETLEFEPHFGWVNYLELPYRLQRASVRRQ
jgi:hypothetical protein